MKTAIKEMNIIYKTEDQLRNMQGIIGCEVPNNQIYKFDGTLCLPSTARDDISEYSAATTNSQ